MSERLVAPNGELYDVTERAGDVVTVTRCGGLGVEIDLAQAEIDAAAGWTNEA